MNIYMRRIPMIGPLLWIAATACAAPPIFKIIDLQPPDAEISYGSSLNDAGVVVGTFYTPPIIREFGFVWTRGRLESIELPAVFGAKQIRLNDVSENGRRVGSAWFPALAQIHKNLLMNGSRGFIQDGDAFRRLDPLPDRAASFVSGVNSNGLVIGSSIGAADPNSNTNSPSLQKATLWAGDGPVELIDTPPGDVSLAADVTESGRVLGVSGSIDKELYVAWIWDNGVATLLEPPARFPGAIPLAINESGWMAGRSVFIAFEGHALVWTNDAVIDLGVFEGDMGSDAYDLNERGQVVGDTLDQRYAAHPFLWQKGVLYNLNDLLVDGASSDIGPLTNARAINNNGWIAAQSGNHAVLLVPVGVRGCPFDLDGDGVVGVNDLQSVLGFWGGAYATSDLSTLIGSWGACPP